MEQVGIMLQWLQNQLGTVFNSQLPLLFVLILSGLSLPWLLNRISSPKASQIPSPPALPIIGNLLQLGRSPHRSLRDLSLKYGPLMLMHIGHSPTLVVSSAETARLLKTDHDVAFSNRPSMTAGQMLFYGGINMGFSPYGEFWKQLRKISVMDLLSVKKVQSFKSIREEEAAHMIQRISRSAQDSVNLTEMLIAYSNNIVSRCALGRKSESEDGGKRLGELTREFMRLLGAFSIGDFFPMFGWLDTIFGLHRKMKKVSGELDIFLDQVIDEHLTPRKYQDPDHNQDFVDILLQIQKDDTLDIPFTKNNVKALLLDMFVGGTDTTSTSMEWVMTELVKNPDIMLKAKDEVRRVAGKKSKVNEEDIQHMVYLRSVIKETLRLHPPIPFIVVASSTSTNVQGYHVPAKTRAYINVWAIQRDAETFQSPEEFMPERFTDSPIDFKGHDYGFIPFGSGRRICPGMSFALNVLELAIASLLYWFDWELPGGANANEVLDMRETFGITLTRKIPLHLVPLHTEI